MVTCFAGPGGVYPIEQKSRQLLLEDRKDVRRNGCNV